MSSTITAAVIAIAALAATGGLALAAGATVPSGWHMPWASGSGYGGGMMGGSHMGDGMMGRGSQSGYDEGTPCPMYSNGTWDRGNWTQMPCWGDNQTGSTSSGWPACMSQEYCLNWTENQNPTGPYATCQGYVACPGWTYATPAEGSGETAPLYDMPCH